MNSEVVINIPDDLWNEMLECKFLTNMRMDHKVKEMVDLQGIMMALIFFTKAKETRHSIVKELSKIKYPYMINVYDNKWVIGSYSMIKKK